MTVDASDAPGAELRALGQAGEQALTLIRQATASGNGGTVSAIEAVILLDDALRALRPLQVVVPELLAAARPGPAVTSGVSVDVANLATLEEQLAAARQERDLALAREQLTRERLAELSSLRAQATDLRRLERLVVVLDELNRQRDLIEERLATLRQLTGTPEQAITASGAELAVLAEERRALLAPQARDALSRAEAALRSLAETEESARGERERLAAAEERRAALVAERDVRLKQLEAHARADNALAAALASAGPAGTAGRAGADAAAQLRQRLDDITAQLTTLDVALRSALADRQGSYDQEHADLGWSDTPPGGGAPARGR